MDGKWIEYSDSEEENIRRERTYRDGKLNGKWIEYDKDGNMTKKRERSYLNGECIEGDCPAGE